MQEKGLREPFQRFEPFVVDQKNILKAWPKIKAQEMRVLPGYLSI